MLLDGSSKMSHPPLRASFTPLRRSVATNNLCSRPSSRDRLAPEGANQAKQARECVRPTTNLDGRQLRRDNMERVRPTTNLDGRQLRRDNMERVRPTTNLDGRQLRRDNMDRVRPTTKLDGRQLRRDNMDSVRPTTKLDGRQLRRDRQGVRLAALTKSPRQYGARWSALGDFGG